MRNRNWHSRAVSKRSVRQEKKLIFILQTLQSFPRAFSRFLQPACGQALICPRAVNVRLQKRQTVSTHSHPFQRYPAQYFQLKRLLKNVPLLVGNIGPDTFGKDENELTLFDASGVKHLPRADKLTLARTLVEEISKRL